MPTQTLAVPLITEGVANTVTTVVEVQPGPEPYEMSAVPPETAVTTPVEPTVAIAGSALDHTPVPVTLSVNVLPPHRYTEPVIAPGAVVTVTVFVA